jgi:hypothetical protein
MAVFDGPARRAEDAIRSNLSLFSPDGRASCTYIYPLAVNDRGSRFADLHANDQDWALVHDPQRREERIRRIAVARIGLYLPVPVTLQWRREIAIEGS